MDGVICDESKVKLVTNEVANPPFTTLQMLLSLANITPTETTVAADLTGSEVAVTGYARQTVTGWGTPALDGAHRAATYAGSVTFLNTGVVPSGTIYTWGFIDTATGHLVVAGRFAVPFILAAVSGTYSAVPIWRSTGS